MTVHSHGSRCTCTVRGLATLPHQPQVHNCTATDINFSLLWHWRTVGVRITSLQNLHTSNANLCDPASLNFNDAGSHNSMQSIEHCTGDHTKLYAVRACCTVCNTHAERSCEVLAEWVTFEADLWNVDSRSSTNYVWFGHCVNIGVQWDGFPAPVPSGKASFALQKRSRAFSSSARRRIHL